MLWLLKFVIKLMVRVGLIVAAAAAGFATGLFLLAREEQRTWAVVPADVERELPGDELVPLADTTETRSLRIEAPPEAVWPWLAQMGWGRGGWYTYDKLDMDQPSADSILEEFQDLAEGDLVPAYPDGGFVARVVEPDHALVLYLSSEQIQEQSEAARGAQAADSEATDDAPAGLQAAGAMSEMTMPDFRATWTFVLEPEAGGGTRLIERLRMWTGEGGLAQQVGLPFVGVGVFLMTRKHMLGVKERAERHSTAQEG